MQLRLKLDNLKEAMNKNCNIKITPRVFMNMLGVNKMYKTRSDL